MFDGFARQWPLSTRSTARCRRQDRPVVESSDPAVAPDTGESSVPTDEATLTFRTWYHQALAATSEADPR